MQGSIQCGGGGGGRAKLLPQILQLPSKTSSSSPVYSCGCTVVVIVLTCGLIASPPDKNS